MDECGLEIFCLFVFQHMYIEFKLEWTCVRNTRSSYFNMQIPGTLLTGLGLGPGIYR